MFTGGEEFGRFFAEHNEARRFQMEWNRFAFGWDSVSYRNKIILCRLNPFTSGLSESEKEVMFHKVLFEKDLPEKDAEWKSPDLGQGDFLII